ncbi:MAG TPA: peptidase inhibitor family I36 protein [Asanoa sp.]|nr:peptidase inhibitor family I36 protein [Asanoa sp.]
MGRQAGRRQRDRGRRRRCVTGPDLAGSGNGRRLGAVAAREPQGCPSGNMCAYKDVDLHGDFIWAYYCNGIYTVPWVTRGSWFNNQTGGVTAVFADNDWRRIGDTGPAPSRQWSGFDWRPVHGIDPC